MTLHVITASRLRDGAIVWLGRDAAWLTDFADALPFDEATLPTGLAMGVEAVRRQFVTGFMQIEVEPAPAGGLRPASVRERIRATGPSVHPDFAYPKPAVIGA